MKKEKVFFHPIDGSGSLSISWSSKPKGDAVEAQKGNGVGFFSEKGDVLGVIFDEVQAAKDHQILVFDRIQVEINVKNGQVKHTLTKRLLRKVAKSVKSTTIKKTAKRKTIRSRSLGRTRQRS